MDPDDVTPAVFLKLRPPPNGNRPVKSGPPSNSAASGS